MNLDCNVRTPNDDEIKALLYQCVRNVYHMTEQLSDIVSALNNKPIKGQSKGEFVISSPDSSQSSTPSDVSSSEIENSSSDSSYCYELYKIKCRKCLNKHQKPNKTKKPEKIISNPEGKNKVKTLHILNKHEKSMVPTEDHPPNVQHGLFKLGRSDAEKSTDLAQLKSQNFEQNQFILPDKINSVFNEVTKQNNEETTNSYSHSHQIPFHFIASKDSDMPAERDTTFQSSSLMSTKLYSRSFTPNDDLPQDKPVKLANLVETEHTKKNENKHFGYNFKHKTKKQK